MGSFHAFIFSSVSEMSVSTCDLKYECVLFLHLEMLYVNHPKCDLLHRCLKSTTSLSILSLLKISFVPFTHSFFIFLHQCFLHLFSAVTSAVMLLSASDLCPPCNSRLLLEKAQLLRLFSSDKTIGSNDQIQKVTCQPLTSQPPLYLPLHLP